MEKLCRSLFLLVVLTYFTGIAAYSQIIEKAPPSPVAIQPLTTDSVNVLVVITDVIISGYKKTKPYIIQREVPFKKGEYILNSELNHKLALCKQQLMNTTLFVDVDVKPVKLDSNHIYIDIHVKERWYLFPIPYFRIVSRNFNTWWFEENHSFQRVNYGLKFMQNNVTGRNDNLNLWFVGGYTQQLSLRYENPNIDHKLKNGINVGFGYSRNRELNYAINHNKQSFFKQPDNFVYKQMYVDFAYTYRPAIKTRHIFRVSYYDININDTILTLNNKFLAPGLKRVRYPDFNYTLQYSNLDYNPYPLKGFAGEATFYKRFGKNSNVWELNGRANYAIKVSPRSFVQLQGAGLVRLPFKQPYITNNLMGSTDLYMRGLEYYVVQGVAGGVARATVKNEVLSLNVRNPIKSKTHDKIPFRVFLKAFGDIGYSYMPDYGNSKLNNKLLRTWGAGIDIVTFYDIVVRLEYSFNQLGDQGMFIHTQTDF